MNVNTQRESVAHIFPFTLISIFIFLFDQLFFFRIHFIFVLYNSISTVHALCLHLHKHNWKAIFIMLLKFLLRPQLLSTLPIKCASLNISFTGNLFLQFCPCNLPNCLPPPNYIIFFIKISRFIEFVEFRSFVQIKRNNFFIHDIITQNKKDFNPHFFSFKSAITLTSPLFLPAKFLRRDKATLIITLNEF